MLYPHDDAQDEVRRVSIGRPSDRIHSQLQIRIRKDRVMKPATTLAARLSTLESYTTARIPRT
jgi:hypothetical protein